MSMLRRHREAAQGFKPPAPPVTPTLRREDHEALMVALTKTYEGKLSQAHAELEECAQAYRKLHREHRRLEQMCAHLEAKLAEVTSSPPKEPAPVRQPTKTKTTRG